MEETVWGWKIVLYLWVAGLAGGAYLTSMLVNLWDGKWHRDLVRACTYVTIPLLLAGAFLLTIDLGQPGRVWHLFSAWRPGSAMWLGTYILLLGSLVGAGLIVHEMLHLMRIRVPWEEALEYLMTWLGLLFACVLVVYVAVLLASTSRVFWSATVLIPALFTASAFSMGTAAIILLLRFVQIDFPGWVVGKLRLADAVFILFELAVLAILVVWLAFFSTPVARQAVKGIVLSPLGAPFWIGVVLLGLLVPLLIELGYARALGKRLAVVTVVSPLLVILGGLALRYVVVFGGQMGGWVSLPI